MLIVSFVSGSVAFVPYLLWKFYFLGVYGFIAWIPINAYRMVKDVILSFLGVFTGLIVLPQIKILEHT